MIAAFSRSLGGLAQCGLRPRRQLLNRTRRQPSNDRSERDEDRAPRAVIVKVTQGDKGRDEPGVRRVDDRRAGDHGDALPQRRRRLRLREHAAHGVRGRAQGQTRRHDRALDADIAEANKVTLKMLANQTSGYPDFETDPAWLAAWSANPFTSGLSRSGSSTRSAAPCSSLRERTGATRTPTS